MSLVGALRASLTLDSAEFVKGSKRAQNSSDKLKSNLATLSGTMKKVGIALAAAGAGLAYAIKGQLNYIDQIGDMAEKLGVPVKEMSRLAYAAKAVGVPLETLEMAIGKLSKGMADAADGTGPAAEVFKKLGVDVLDSTGKMRESEAVLQDLSDRLVAMPDGAAKTAMAMELFGKSGAEMLLMLNNGGEGLRVLTAEAKKMGMEITEEQAKSAGNFSNNIERLKTLAGGLGLKLAAALAPALESITNWLIKFVTDDFPRFMAAAQQLFADIGAKLSGWATSVSETFGQIGTWMAQTWADIKNTIGGAIDFVSQKWVEFVAQLQAAVDTAKAVGAAIRDAMTVTPMAPGGGFEGGGGGGGKSGGGGLVPSSYTNGAAAADGTVEGFKTRLSERMGEITAAADGLTRAVKDRWQIASPSRVFHEIGGHLSEGLAQGIAENKPMVDQAMNELGDGIEGKADSLASKLESFKSSFQNAFVGLVTGAQSFKEAIGQIASQLAKMAAEAAFQQLFGNLFKGGGLLGNIFGFADGGAFGNGRVMAFANGGIVNGATAFGMQGGLGVMGEAGPEAIMPLARGKGGKLGVVAQGGVASRMDIHIHENPMFAARVEGIADDRAVAVTRSYDREVAPQSRNRHPRERG
jgi:TP901 family phage tail tape measure protein